MDPDNVHILAKTGIVRTISGNNNISTDYAYGSDLQIYPTYIQMYSSGGWADMWFDGIK